MDEGLIIQSAEGLLHTGKASLPVAPSIYEPAWYITTGFPLTLPLAGVFSIFDVSLEAARLLMLAFLLCLYVVLFLYARRTLGAVAAWFGIFLLVFFGPIYGNGRNVLGEIPGLLFILIALLPFIRSGALTRKRIIWTGVATGLAVATKPIFILFLPALLLALALRWKELELTKVFLFGAIGMFVPLVLWAFIQFDHVTLSQVLSVYANPHDVNIGNAIITNLKRIGTEMQPLYFFGALVLWVTSYGVRRFRREYISLPEEVLLFFSVLVFLAYLRTAGYYRYFFPAQVFTLLYLPQSAFYLARGYGRSFTRAAIICVCGLILFQAYETMFRSWTAVHYNSTRTNELKEYFATLPLSQEIFVYQAPEVVPFVGKRPLYQYVEITPSIRAGERYTNLILSGQVLRVITYEDLYTTHNNTLFIHYKIERRVDSYIVLMTNVPRI